MTKRKKSMIGHDPLAWIDPDMDDELDEAAQANEHPLGIDVDAFVQGFDLVKDKISDVVAEFYQNLFNQYPEVKPLFDNTDISAQGGKLVAALALLVENINDVEQLTRILTTLGKQHQGYGATQEHYAAVAKTLLASLKKYAGRKWTKKIANNWAAVLNTAAEVMLAAYEDKSDDNAEAKSETSELESKDAENDFDQTEVVELNPLKQQKPQQGVLYLEAIQDISVVADLLQNIKSKFDEPEFTIDVSRVTRIDASSLQLLYLLMNGVVAGSRPRLQGSSEAFDYAVKLLGMTNTLKIAA